MTAATFPRFPSPAPRALVMGYHTMGCVGFDALLRHGFEIAAVLTHRDDPGEEVWWESLAERAGRRGIPVHFPEKGAMRSPELAELVASYRPELIFSFYFRFMIPAGVLELAPLGALNLHGSLLPAYRGRAPVNWVLVNGEEETGVTLHYMVAKPDAGAIVDRERVAIGFSDTALILFRKLELAAVRLLDRALPLLREGRAAAVPMDLAAGSYFGGRTPEDGEISWAWPALRIYNLVRAVTHPYPGAFTFLEGRKLFIWWATPCPLEAGAEPGRVVETAPDGVLVATGEGGLLLARCQIEGMAECDARELARVASLRPGARLGGVGEIA